MKKTFPDRLKAKVHSWYKAHPKGKYLYQAVGMTGLFLYYTGMHLVNNGKRILCALAVLLFFVSNASFTRFGNGEVIKVDAAENSDIALVTELDVDETKVALAASSQAEEVFEGEVVSNESDMSFTLEDILNEHEDYLNNVSLIEEAVPSQKENLTFDSNDWRITLVNKQHPIPDDWTVELEEMKNGMLCDKRIMEDLVHMLNDARDAGNPLAINSYFRSTSDQVFLFNRKINKYKGLGMSYMDAYKTAAYSVTLPGASEHQMGMALDIVGSGYNVLDEAFKDTKAGIWLRDNSYKYGFILRYPQGKEHITGIEFEPWHFRYVGVDAAYVIYENDLCLEEFWDEYVY